MLFVFIVNIVLNIISPAVAGLWGLATLLPALAVGSAPAA